MKIAIVGASGFLASNLAFFLGEKSGMQVVGVSRTKSQIFTDWIPYLGPHNLATDLHDNGVSYIINCAAITSHEKAAADPDAAYKVNALLAEDIATVASDLNIGLCHISTDAVYNGNSITPHTEESPKDPRTAYGASKLLGEQLVLNTYPQALVARTNFFGWSPQGSTGILDFFHYRLKNNQKTVGFTDYRVSSIYVGHLARVLTDLFYSSKSGVFNIGASEPMSKYEFGVQVADTFGFDSRLIESGSIHDDVALSTRGLFLGLETTKVAIALGQAMPSTLEGIEEAKEDQEKIFRWFGRQG